MYLLEMNHIRKSFGDLEVIKDISLNVEEGEIVSIIGPSGSGKSTLLRCATMLETIDSGQIVYLGKKAAWSGENGQAVYAPKGELKEIQKSYGLVFQNFNLFPHFSVLKNIVHAPLCVQKRNKEQVYYEAEILLQKMGLSDKAEAYPCQLSGGCLLYTSLQKSHTKDGRISPDFKGRTFGGFKCSLGENKRIICS